MPSMKRSRSVAFLPAGYSARKRQRTSSVAATASAALRMARELKRGIETKAVGISRTGTVTTTEDVKHLSAIAQGDGNSQRSGDHVMATRVRLRGMLTGNSALSFQAAVRIIIVQNLRQQPDTNATMASQFSSATIYGFNLASLGFKNLLVHYDKVHMVPQGSQVASTPTFATGRKFIDVDFKLARPVKISYNEAAVTDIDRNGFYIICVADASSSQPSLVYEAFLDYTDA